MATGLETLEVGEHLERVVVFVEEHVGHGGLLGQAARSAHRDARFGELIAEKAELAPLDVDAGGGLVPPEAKEIAPLSHSNILHRCQFHVLRRIASPLVQMNSSVSPLQVFRTALRAHGRDRTKSCRRRVNLPK